jgi:hypothetical protein
MKWFLALVSLLCLSTPLYAQAGALVNDPTTIQFTASAVDPSTGSDNVDHYSANLILFGGTFQFSKNIGKPVQDANRLIKIPFPFSLSTDLQKNVKYFLTVTAYGTPNEDPTLKADSNASNPFVHAVPVAPTAPGTPVVQ